MNIVPAPMVELAIFTVYNEYLNNALVFSNETFDTALAEACTLRVFKNSYEIIISTTVC